VSGLSVVRGILKGYDLMANLVLDETVETLPGKSREGIDNDDAHLLYVVCNSIFRHGVDPDDPDTLSDDTRKLGKKDPLRTDAGTSSLNMLFCTLAQDSQCAEDQL